MEFLNEVYFGKKPLSNIQKQLSIIRKGIQNGKIRSAIDTDMLKFDKMMEYQFGFHQFSINIDYISEQPTAYMLSMGDYLSDKDKANLYKSIKATQNGFKYLKDGIKISGVIYVGYNVWLDKRLSDEEIMAVILHEIGHCFFDAVIRPTNYTTCLRKMNNLFEHIYSFINNKLRSDINITKNMIFSDFNKHISNIINVKSVFYKFKSKMLHESMMDNFTHNKYGYAAEKFADSFAVSYGYGAELNSALVTFICGNSPDKYNHITHNIFVDYIKCAKYIVFNYFKFIVNPDKYNEMYGHPEILARIKFNINDIKRELNREKIDPLLKKELLNELERSEKVIENFNNVSMHGDYFAAYRKYAKFLYKFFEGDFREHDFDNDALLDTIDDTYAKLIEI